MTIRSASALLMISFIACAPARPEECDGIDNDHNGRVDDGPDGGPLTKACRLSLGVCAGAMSICRGGQWTACDYGPDYQLTERACDGLDNDCDGRVDVSWARQVLAADAGDLEWGPLAAWDTFRPFVTARDGGVWFTLPYLMLTTDPDLTPVARLDFPWAGEMQSALYPDGDHWLRITGQWDVRTSTDCFSARSLTEVAGLPSLDSSLMSWGSTCVEAGRPSGAVVLQPVSGGWFAAPMHFSVRPLEFAFFTDGGVESRRVVMDGGALLDGPIVFAGRPFFGDFNNSSFSTFFELVPATSTLRPAFTLNPGVCNLWDTTPPTALCSPGGLRTIVAGAGGLTLGPTLSPDWLVPLTSVEGTTDGLYAVLPTDGGSPGSASLVAITSGGMSRITEFDGRASSVNLHPVSGRLKLVTWDDGAGKGPCPFCGIDGFYAEYVCTP